MKSVPAHPSQRDPFPPHAETLAFPIDRVRPEIRKHPNRIPRFAAAEWRLGYLDLSDTAKAMTIVWSGFPEYLRDELRTLAWVMLNHGLDPTLVGQRSVHLEQHPAATTVHATSAWWRTFARWLQTHRPLVSRLGNLSTDDYNAWAAHVRKHYRSVYSRQCALAAVSRLHGHSWLLPSSERPPAPPWLVRRSMARYLGPTPKHGENSTPPISAPTISALIAWATKIVDDFAVRVAAPNSRPLKPLVYLVVSGAAIVLLAYFTGMRPKELTLLPIDCLRETEAETGGIRYEIFGPVVKGQRDDEGRHLSQGRMRGHPWLTIEQGAKAVRTLQHLARTMDSQMLIAPGPQSSADRDVRGIPSNKAGDRIKILIRHVNRRLSPAQSELPAIPPDPNGPVTLSRFRRTLAWHIARQPGGEVALGVQYGHLRLVTGQGYAGHKQAGLQDLIDFEEMLATFDLMEELAEERDSGSEVSGPAGTRLKGALDNFQSQYLGGKMTEKEAVRLMALPGFQVYDNPGAMLVCVFRPESAACLNPSSGPSTRRTPALQNCQKQCTNIARLDSHVSTLTDERDGLLAEAAISPMPIADRLHECAQVKDEIIAAHGAQAEVGQPDPTQ